MLYGVRLLSMLYMDSYEKVGPVSSMAQFGVMTKPRESMARYGVDSLIRWDLGERTSCIRRPEGCTYRDDDNGGSLHKYKLINCILEPMDCKTIPSMSLRWLA